MYKGGEGVLQVFVLAEVEITYGSWFKVHGSQLKKVWNGIKIMHINENV